MTTDTKVHVQPYQYHPLPGNLRVVIIHPAGATYTMRKAEIINRLEEGKVGLRELSAHERIMLENALAAFGDNNESDSIR